MAARPGSENPLSGPRLPIGIEPLTPEHEELPDAAHGEKVPRCRTCGRPGIGRRINDFTLYLGGRRAGSYRICDECYYAANPIDPQAGDPLRAA